MLTKNVGRMKSKRLKLSNPQAIKTTNHQFNNNSLKPTLSQNSQVSTMKPLTTKCFHKPSMPTQASKFLRKEGWKLRSTARVWCKICRWGRLNSKTIVLLSLCQLNLVCLQFNSKCLLSSNCRARRLLLVSYLVQMSLRVKMSSTNVLCNKATIRNVEWILFISKQ